MTLREVFNAPPNDTPSDWLYLPGEHTTWTLDSEAYFPPFDPESDELVLATDYANRGYRETIDLQTIEDVVRAADRLAGGPDDAVRLEAFIYYVRFDAPLPRIGAPEPPPAHEVIQHIDRQFYDALGPEDATRPCKSPGCSRGSVRFSVLCRVHHFESVSPRPCPFND
jgi:hypothetical protein